LFSYYFIFWKSKENSRVDIEGTKGYLLCDGLNLQLRFFVAKDLLDYLDDYVLLK
jgi:hypothetical protein